MHVKDTAKTALVLERLPNGTYAWLKPEGDRRYILPGRYWLTDRGRRAVAFGRLFGPSPTVAQAVR